MHLFHKPAEEGEVSSPVMFDEIDASIEYLPVKEI